MPYPGDVIYDDEFDSAKMSGMFKMHLLNLCSVLFDEKNLDLNYFNGKYLRGWELYNLITQKWSKDFGLDSTKIKKEGPDESLYRLAHETAKDYFDKIMNYMINNCKTIEELHEVNRMQR